MARSPEDAQNLEAGVVVKLKGLVGAAQHNGKHGELVSFDEEKGRWSVKLQSDLSILGVKPVYPIQPTITPACTVLRHGLGASSCRPPE